MKYECLTKDRLERDIVAALKALYHSDFELVRQGVSERCLTGRFLAYFQSKTAKCGEYTGLNIDPEYNRQGSDGDPKCIEDQQRGKVNVIPDIVIHCRESKDANICVMEFKKEGMDGATDYWKLARLTGTGHYYRYGVHIVLGHKTAILSWFMRPDNSDFGELCEQTEYNVISWERISLADMARRRKRRSCMLMITRRCNLNCTYCYEHHKCSDSSYDMTFETARRLLCAEFEHVKCSDEFDEIEVDFMGGEPFMNFPLIRDVVEWLEQEPPPVPYVCFATTNATLLEEHKAWLEKHRTHFILGGSFDGTEGMQGVNRGTEVKNRVALDLLWELYPEQGLHMTVSKESLPNLAEGVLYLQRRGFRVVASLAQGVNWTAEDAEEYERQLNLLGEAYLGEDRDLRPINLLTRYLGSIDGHPEQHRQKKYCGTGTHMVAYDYDGKAYACHMFTPLVLGNDAMPLGTLDFKCPAECADRDCEQCVLKSCCPTCAGFNYRYRGKIGARDHRWCLMMYVQFMVASVFQQKFVAAKIKPLADDIRYLKGAYTAFKTLKETGSRTFHHSTRKE